MLNVSTGPALDGLDLMEEEEEVEDEEGEEFSEDDEQLLAGNGNNNQGDEDDDEEEEESSEMTASEDEASWISWFINMRGNDFFCEVEESFIQDDFNLTGLSSQVPYYDYALDMILDVDIPLDTLTEDQHEIIETAAEVLYGLIHARYILTAAGMHKMFEKYQNVDFGRCPRSFCQGQPVLPVGLSDITREFSVEVFCPRCHDTYHPRSSKHSNLDGAYFGTTFSHLFLLSHPDLIVNKPTEKYVP
jgi:casein kinase II subunit beta